MFQDPAKNSPFGKDKLFVNLTRSQCQKNNFLETADIYYVDFFPQHHMSHYDYDDDDDLS